MLKHVLVMLAVMANLAQAADCELDSKALLDQYVTARGGAEAIEAQRALRLISRHHEGGWSPVFDYRVMKPGYMWIAAIYEDGEIITEGFDGKRGWEKWGSKPAEYVGGDAEKGVNQGALSPVHLYGLHQMEELGAKLTLKACSLLDDQLYYVLNVVSRFGTDIDYYINAANFRLERSRTTRPLHPTQDPTPIQIEERWVDFRSVDGVLHPFGFSLWNVDTEEKLSWLEIYSISTLPKAKPEHFEKPD